MRITPRHVDAERVVEAAVALAFSGGLVGVTLEAVAARCGVSVRAVRRVQGDEAVLVALTFTRIARAELTETERIVLIERTPERQLRTLLETVTEPSGVELDTIWGQSWSLGRRNAALAEAVREQEGRWHTTVAGVLRRGIASGAFLPADVDDLAAQILAICVGVNSYSLVGYRSDADRLRLLTTIVSAELGVRFDDDADEPERAEIEVGRLSGS